MDIFSLIVAIAIVFVVWWVVKGVATIIGMVVIGGLVYYMHSSHPLWIDQISNAVQTWVF